MQLWRFTFSHEAFYRLPDEKRIFWLQLAQIRNDLRAIDGICIPSLNVVRPNKAANQYSEQEQWIALHQLTFAIRQLCGTLEQAHEVVHKGWHGTQLSKQMDSLLSQDAKNGLKAFNQYFSRPNNIVTVIRQKFAHHFNPEILKGRLCSCAPDELHEFITGQTYGNTFYKFAEDLRYHAIVRAIGGKSLQEAIAKLYDEPRQSALRPFETFADDVLFKIAKELDVKITEANIGQPSDPRSLRPFLFFPDLEPDSAADTGNYVA
jgi:hypothetical protein